MRRFTKEELETLTKIAEHTFKTAVYSNYKRATVFKNDGLVADIYEAAGGEKQSRNFSCGQCALNLYKKVGSKYFEDKEYYEKLEEKQAEDEIVEMVTQMAQLENVIKEKPTKNKKPTTRGRKPTNKTKKEKE